MALSYANMTTQVLQTLRDTGATTYTATITDYAVKAELKRLSQYEPYLIDVMYKIESRSGTDTAGTADKLTDTTESQFLAADSTNVKVVHNTTDDTWATVTGYTSTSVLSLSANIMANGENYEIYNKRCRNKKQIYVGDMPPILWIESVEYPVGTERNFKYISQDIIELDVLDSTIQDSDSTLSSLGEVFVLVKFAIPQVLCKLTDLAGALTAGAAADVTSIAVGSLSGTETIEVGELFTLAGKAWTYVVTASVTLSGGAGTVSFYPGLEAAASNTDVVTFEKSSLRPRHEDLLERMICSRAVQGEQMNYTTSMGSVLSNFQRWITGNPSFVPSAIERDLRALVRKRASQNHPDRQ